jgi:hypothetical protein
MIERVIKKINWIKYKNNLKFQKVCKRLAFWLAKISKVDLFEDAAAKKNFVEIIKYVEGRRTKKKLEIDGQNFEYLFHSYNNLGLTERSVEIPIIQFYLNNLKPKDVLEIGNVTNYYQSYYENSFPNKTVVDKIEYCYNVITSDIAKYFSDKKFDFIFSISTFEHMDSDLDRNPDYKKGSAKSVSIAADNIIHCYENLLATNGTLLITAPMGYTPEWDLTFKNDWLLRYGFNNVTRHLYKRISIEEWIKLDSVNLNDEMKYDEPFPYANYVAVIEIKK